MDIINNCGQNKFPTAGTAVPLPATNKPPQRTPKESAAASTQTTTGSTAEQQQLRLPITDSRKATATTHQHQRQALPSPKRTLPDEIAEGSSSKQERRQEPPTGPTRPDAVAEPPTARQRITAVTIKTKEGNEITACSSEDTNGHITEMILFEPIIHDTEGLDKQLPAQGMKKEIQQMKQQKVYTEVHIDTLTPQQRQNIIQSRWVLHSKGTEVRARIVAKGFTEPVTDIDNIYASAPIYSVFRLLLTFSRNNNWTVRTGDISVALHAAAATSDLYMYPPTEFYNESDGIILEAQQSNLRFEKLTKSMANTPSRGLATALPTKIRCRAQHLRHAAAQRLHPGLCGRSSSTRRRSSNKQDQAIQQHLLLRPAGTLTVGNTVFFLRHNITNRGDYYELGLAESHNKTLLEEANIENCKPATAPGTAALKTSTADHDQPLSQGEHKAFRPFSRKTAVGDIHQTRHLLCNRELPRALQQPTSADQQKLKNMLRYIKGTTHYKQVIRPTVKLMEATHDLNVFDSDWAT